MLRTRQTLAPSLAVLTLASVAPTASGDGPSPPDESIPIPASIVAEDGFTRMVDGDFDGDERSDLAFLSGDRLALAFGVEYHTAYQVVPFAVHDMDVVAGVDAQVDRDLLVAVGPGGLYEISVDAELFELTWQLIDSGDWAGARRVRTAHVNDDGREDVVGVAWDDLEVLSMRRLPTGWAPGAGHVSPYPVLAIETLEWNGDGPQTEVALDTVDGLYVVSASGALHEYHRATHVEGWLAALGDPGDGAQRLAWGVRMMASDDPMIVVVDEGGPEAPIPMPGLSAIGTGDADFDGEHELAVLDGGLRLIGIHLNSAMPGASFGTPETSGFQTSTLAPDGSVDAGWPVLVDLDRDGLNDMAHPSDADGAIQIYRGPLVDILPTSSQGMLLSGAACYGIDEGGQGWVAFETLVTASPPSPGGPGPDFSHVELVSWVQEDLDGDVARLATFRHLFELEEFGAGVPLWLAFPLIGVDDPPWTDDAILYGEARLVEVDEINERVVRAGPGLIAAFSGTETSLESLPTPDGASIFSLETCDIITGDTVAHMVHSMQIGTFPDGTIPDPAPDEGSLPPLPGFLENLYLD